MEAHNNIKNSKMQYVFYGAIIYASLMSLFQDIVGKQGYVKMVEDHWINPAISVPLAVMAIVFCLIKIYSK